GSDDVVYLHYDLAPDRDDLHAMLANDQLATMTGQRVTPVIGTCGLAEKCALFVGADAINWADQLYGAGNYRNVYNRFSAFAGTQANEWDDVISRGGRVYVAEGGPSDYTAAVLRLMSEDRSQVTVVQHSAVNEKNTGDANLNDVKAQTTYIKIQDGNFDNTSAGLKSAVGANTPAQNALIASDSRWKQAFGLQGRVDFSDTVEFLHILGIDKAQIGNIAQFANAVTASGTAVPAQTDPVASSPDANPDNSAVKECAVAVKGGYGRARALYERTCTLPRKDCDPYQGYKVCASVRLTHGNIAGIFAAAMQTSEPAVGAALPPPAPTANSTTTSHTDQCAVSGVSLSSARKNYAFRCNVPRKDCDRVNGMWICASFKNPRQVTE
ncbi:MAG: hypothetical protein AAF404_22950, partial [Pseudomonadota bacterium]